MIPLLLAAAWAAEPVPVLVSGLQPSAPAATGLAALLEGYLAQLLADEPDVLVRRVEEAPPFPDYDARVYIDGCPPGNIEGCTLVIGDRVQARYAITGSVLPLAVGSRVRISILDITDSRVVVTFRTDVAPGEDHAFADSVVKVMRAVVAGQIGSPDDIRDQNSPMEGEDGAVERGTDAEIAAQLAELSPELAAAADVATQPRGSIERPNYTLEDLENVSDEGLAPWAQVGLSPGQYLRYRNSRLQLFEWKKRAMGHQFQLLLRVEGGWWRGPTGGLYYNRHAYDTQLTVVDSYTALAAQTHGAPTAGGEVAFGLLPSLDIGFAAGASTGSLLIDIAADGSAEGAEQTTTVYPGRVWFGPRLEAAFLPAGVIHPAIGAGATITRTPSVAKYVELPEYAAALPPGMLVYGSVWPGVQVRLADALDFYARIPVDFLLAGDPVVEERDTTTSALVPTAPMSDTSLAVSVLVGLQVRLFGRTPENGPVEANEP